MKSNRFSEGYLKLPIQWHGHSYICSIYVHKICFRMWGYSCPMVGLTMSLIIPFDPGCRLYGVTELFCLFYYGAGMLR